MFVKNSNFAIYLALAAVVGFGAATLFFKSDFQKSLLNGDISKANVYSNQKEDPALTVLEERLQHDEDLYNTTKTVYDIIGNRVSSLEDLTEKTIEICADMPEFKKAIKDIVSLNAKAFNTKQFVMHVNFGLNNMAEGKKAVGFEQASNNVYVGFKKIENQLAIGKAFVNVANSYLENSDNKKCDEIANLVAEWSIFCAQDAYLNGNSEEVTYWNDKANTMAAAFSSVEQAYMNLQKDIEGNLKFENNLQQEEVIKFDGEINFENYINYDLDNLGLQDQRINAFEFNDQSIDLAKALDEVMQFSTDIKFVDENINLNGEIDLNGNVEGE